MSLSEQTKELATGIRGLVPSIALEEGETYRPCDGSRWADVERRLRNDWGLQESEEVAIAVRCSEDPVAKNSTGGDADPLHCTIFAEVRLFWRR